MLFKPLATKTGTELVGHIVLTLNINREKQILQEKGKTQSTGEKEKADPMIVFFIYFFLPEVPKKFHMRTSGNHSSAVVTLCKLKIIQWIQGFLADLSEWKWLLSKVPSITSSFTFLSSVHWLSDEVLGLISAKDLRHELSTLPTEFSSRFLSCLN